MQEMMKQESVDRVRTLQMLKALEAENETANIVSTVLRETNALLVSLKKKSKMVMALENKLVAAIEKKKNDMERSRKLLESLNIELLPSYQAEYEYNQVEEKFQVEYERYVVKVRNIDFLEGELRFHHSLLQREREEHKNRRVYGEGVSDEVSAKRGVNDFDVDALSDVGTESSHSADEGESYEDSDSSDSNF